MCERTYTPAAIAELQQIAQECQAVRTVYIYTLSDPDTKQVMYVGQTIKIATRLNQHLRGSFKKETPKNTWIQSLLVQNKKPLMTVVDSCSEAVSDNIEQQWMIRFSIHGNKLFNDTTRTSVVNHPPILAIFAGLGFFRCWVCRREMPTPCQHPEMMVCESCQEEHKNEPHVKRDVYQDYDYP